MREDVNPDYTEIGVGYEQLQNDPGSVNYDSYWTQVFGNSSEDNSDSSKSLNSDAIEDSTSFTSTPNENLMINTDSSSDRSLFIDDDTKSFDSNPDRMEDSQTFTGTPSEELMVNNDNNSSNKDFEINDNSFDQSPLMKDIKSSDSDSVDSIANSIGFTDVPKGDPMDSNNSSSSDNKFEIGDNSFARSLFMNDNTKSLDSNLVDLIPDSASFTGISNGDPMVSTDNSSDRSFSISNDTKSEDLVDLMDSETQNLINFANDSFTENFGQMSV